ncbi:transcription initiation protein [Microbacterium sp. CFBP9034]|uniref:YciI family protein n=1 Tax=Microbacterium sp. CFBP9034 TaxID=3096540 RepID=UPI002A6B474E|nr:transcription initiation protein [Microbacterium sp. CFBP9034]MDY0909389.1 transcription initiation protein [Microbacterium sp. CFBP9034]
MTKYLISFPGEAMVVPDGEWDDVAAASRAVIVEAQAAGVYVFGGGINEDVDPVVVAADGSVSAGTYPDVTVPNGGYTILELPSRAAAVEWAAKIAVACRCPQELREFQYDPIS